MHLLTQRDQRPEGEQKQVGLRIDVAERLVEPRTQEEPGVAGESVPEHDGQYEEHAGRCTRTGALR